jgi:hypothetical protein
MESYDRDIARYEAFMDAVKRHGLDYVKRAWDFEVCPKEIAKKALEHAGYEFNKIWVLNARFGHNPYTDRDELSVTWLTVAYYLEQKGLVTLRNVTEAKEKVETYCKMI